MLAVLGVAQVIHIDLTLLALAAGFLIPFLTSFLTKQLAPDWVKWTLLTLLSAGGGAVATLIANGGTFAWQSTLLAMAVAWISALAAHYGYNVSGILGAFEAQFFPHFGIGAPHPHTAAHMVDPALTPVGPPMAEVKVIQQVPTSATSPGLGGATIEHVSLQPAGAPVVVPEIVLPESPQTPPKDLV